VKKNFIYFRYSALLDKTKKTLGSGGK